MPFDLGHCFSEVQTLWYEHSHAPHSQCEPKSERQAVSKREAAGDKPLLPWWGSSFQPQLETCRAKHHTLQSAASSCTPTDGGPLGERGQGYSSNVVITISSTEGKAHAQNGRKIHDQLFFPCCIISTGSYPVNCFSGKLRGEYWFALICKLTVNLQNC